MILSSSGHDFLSENLKYKHAPILIKDGAWICIGATLLAGVIVGTNSVVSAGETLRKPLPDFSIYLGGAAQPINYPNE